MLERILIGGSGGQGIISMGRLLAAVAMEHVPHVTFFPSYGIEVRGGTSNCQIVLSSGEIASPVPDEVDTLIAMNQQSLDRFAGQRVAGGLLLVNASLCPEATAAGGAVLVKATDMANDLGDVRVANSIMLGVYQARRPILPLAAMEQEIRNMLAEKGDALIDLNLRAFRAGLEERDQG
jgi:2-oxoglutarate ferredoxin oxidoreductase subunit gamma